MSLKDIQVDIPKYSIKSDDILSTGVNVLFKLVEKLFGPQTIKEFKDTLKSIKIDIDFLYNMLGGDNFL